MGKFFYLYFYILYQMKIFGIIFLILQLAALARTVSLCVKCIKRKLDKKGMIIFILYIVLDILLFLPITLLILLN